MRMLAVIVAFAALSVSLYANNAGRDLSALTDAIVQVESNGRADAVGDGGKAVGVLQIHPIMVADVNRILGREAYTLEDRTDPAKSRAMFEVYSRHYAKAANDWSDEGIARRWNGGPRGHEKRATLGYWRKVAKILGV